MDYLDWCCVMLICLFVGTLLYELSLPAGVSVQFEILYPIFAFCIGLSMLAIVFKVINLKAEEKNQQKLYR